MAMKLAASGVACCLKPCLLADHRLLPAKVPYRSLLTSSSPNSRRHFPICNGEKRVSYTRTAPVESTEEELQEDSDELEEYVEEEYEEDLGDDILADDFKDFEDEFLDKNDDSDPQVGDGGGGGGISLAGTWWDKEALKLAEETSHSFNGTFKLYAFKTLVNSTIRLRIEKMSTKYGSPTMDDIEAFSSAYQLRLDEAGQAGTIPNDITLEVSSPGVERVVRVPEELERFKDRPMYVRYSIMNKEKGTVQEADGVFNLISLDLQSLHCTWAIADVKLNRQKAGKGRQLSKKLRQWRLLLPIDALRLVRLHCDS
ncbi:hypothetical protein HPP92_005360 [Vanilla planifolia]|uniref:Ribosome maturation factor RimP N-terminal domain-containing protein n=1 Tax=Vanilla planifolia TaxID=51239 RepID=A0A835RH93_VANPL|nr:hypothetical protein HPP92_005673 [Vanilla planifolia]KAG0494366.1 hypothetical protein HPP92_005360 [Vanilla planifolia]